MIWYFWTFGGLGFRDEVLGGNYEGLMADPYLQFRLEISFPFSNPTNGLDIKGHGSIHFEKGPIWFRR